MIYCANPSEQFLSYQGEIESAVLKVMRGSQYILGEEVNALEKEFSHYIGVENTIGVANGTDAIELSLRALGIGPGDEVITVSHTAVATVAAIESAGATPVLVDVDSIFYTLDPNQLNEVCSAKTKAIIAVHLYGQAADLDSISDFCDERGLFLIEDVSQAHGATIYGKRLGSVGIVGCFSCYPTKNLGAIGDAGLITTRDSILASKIRMLREYGWEHRISLIAGRNSRLDEIQAAILRIKLKYLNIDNEKRRKIASYYSRELSSVENIDLPTINENNESVFHLFVIQVAEKFGLIEYLKKKNIFVGVHYKAPVHLQPAYQNRIRTSGNMRVTEMLTSKIISLPIYPELAMSDVEKVTHAIKAYYENI